MYQIELTKKKKKIYPRVELIDAKVNINKVVAKYVNY